MRAFLELSGEATYTASITPVAAQQRLFIQNVEFGNVLAVRA